jgi:hypothetical protein
LKSIRGLEIFKLVTLSALALGVSTMHGRAAQFKGKFTLPFQVHWGGANFPAGDYTVDMLATSTPTRYLLVRGSGREAIIVPGVANRSGITIRSRLILVNVDGRYVVRSFQVGEIGTTYGFVVPKSRAKRMAWGQEKTRQVAVSPMGH